MVVLAGAVINVSTGLIEATDGGKLDVQTDSIVNYGVDPLAHVEGILIDGTSALMVDTADLQLTGGGTVTLESGSQIVVNGDNPLLTASGSYLTLDNVDNTIEGAGTIGDGTANLGLDNETGGIVEANASGQTLTIKIGGNTIENAGTLEATGGGTLDIDSAVDNSGTSSNGIVANGGTVDVDAAVTDTGVASISNNGVLEFRSSVALGPNGHL